MSLTTFREQGTLPTEAEEPAGGHVRRARATLTPVLKPLGTRYSIPFRRKCGKARRGRLLIRDDFAI
jgi:hypothetical protein